MFTLRMESRPNADLIGLRPCANGVVLTGYGIPVLAEATGGIGKVRAILAGLLPAGEGTAVSIESRTFSSATPELLMVSTRVAVCPVSRSAWSASGLTAMSGGPSVVAVARLETGEGFPNSSNAFTAK